MDPVALAGLPAFVLGFHGTDASVVDAVLSGRLADLRRSENDYDWPGSGLYFWENSYQRALDWARQFQDRPRRSGTVIRTLAVIGAVIDPGRCLDLLDQAAVDLLRSHYAMVIDECAERGDPVPRNENPSWMADAPDRIYRRLDCAVVESVHGLIAQHNASCVPGARMAEYDSVRAVFLEGHPLYPKSGFLEKTHIQICVRHPTRILGYFRPRMSQG